MSTQTTGDLKLIKPSIMDSIDQTIGIDLAANFEKIDVEVTNRVEKVTGKQLSTEDYTSDEKTKLEEIAAGATKVSDSTTNGNILVNNEEVKVYDDTLVLSGLSNLATESTMPHIFKDLQTNKTYRYGYQISADGIPQLISEEVI